jgi:cytochrome c-type biogenesis protein
VSPVLLLVSFVAGIPTVAAPCVTDADVASRQWFRPIVIALGLVVSVVVFTLLLQATTTLLRVPRIVWQVLAGLIVILFGLTLLFPETWERIQTRIGLRDRANRALDANYRRGGLLGDLLLGASLGPVFSSCSPTYALIVAAVLPSSFAVGLLYLVAYAIGLAATLLLVAFLGQAAARRLGWLSRPRGWLRVTVGVLMVVVGIAIIAGLDRIVQAWVLEQGWYAPIERLELDLRG